MAPKNGRTFFGLFKKKKDPGPIRSESMEQVIAPGNQFPTPPIYKIDNRLNGKCEKTHEDVNGNAVSAFASRKKFAAPPPPPNGHKRPAPTPGPIRTISEPNLLEERGEEREGREERAQCPSDGRPLADDVRLRPRKDIAPPPPQDSSISPLPPKKPTRDFRHSQLIEEERKKVEKVEEKMISEEEEEETRRKEEENRKERKEAERRAVEEVNSRKVEEQRREKEREEETREAERTESEERRRAEKASTPQTARQEKALKTEVIHYSPPGSIRDSSSSFSPEPPSERPHVERKSNIELTDSLRVKSMKVSVYDGAPLSFASGGRPSKDGPGSVDSDRMSSEEMGSSISRLGDTLRRSAEARAKLELHREDMILREKYDALRKKFDLWEMMRASGGEEAKKAARLQKELIAEHDEVMQLLSLQYPIDSAPSRKPQATKKRASLAPDLFAPRHSKDTPTPLSISPIAPRLTHSAQSAGRLSLSPSCSISPSLSSSSEEDSLRSMHTQTARALSPVDENANVLSPKKNVAQQRTPLSPKATRGNASRSDSVAASRVLEDMHELQRREHELRQQREQLGLLPGSSSEKKSSERREESHRKESENSNRREREQPRRGEEGPNRREKEHPHPPQNSNRTEKGPSGSPMAAPKAPIGRPSGRSPALPHRIPPTIPEISTGSEVVVEVLLAPPKTAPKKHSPIHVPSVPPSMTTFRTATRHIQADEKSDPLLRPSAGERVVPFRPPASVRPAVPPSPSSARPGVPSRPSALPVVPSSPVDVPRPSQAPPTAKLHFEAAYPGLKNRPQQTSRTENGVPIEKERMPHANESEEKQKEKEEKEKAAQWRKRIGAPSRSEVPQTPPQRPPLNNKMAAPAGRSGMCVGRVVENGTPIQRAEGGASKATPPKATPTSNPPAKATPPPPPPPLPPPAKASPPRAPPLPSLATPPPPPPLPSSPSTPRSGCAANPAVPSPLFSISELNEQRKRLKTAAQVERQPAKNCSSDARGDLLEAIRKSGGLAGLRKVNSPIKN